MKVFFFNLFFFYFFTACVTCVCIGQMELVTVKHVCIVESESWLSLKSGMKRVQIAESESLVRCV
jgi:hypothetical protein